MLSFRQNLQPDLAVGVIGEDTDWRVSSLAKEQLPLFKLDDALATSRGRGGRGVEDVCLGCAGCTGR